MALQRNAINPPSSGLIGSEQVAFGVAVTRNEHF